MDNLFEKNSANYLGGALFSYKMSDIDNKKNTFIYNLAHCGNNIAFPPNKLQNINIQEYYIYDMNDLNSDQMVEKVQTFQYTIGNDEIYFRNF